LTSTTPQITAPPLRSASADGSSPSHKPARAVASFNDYNLVLEAAANGLGIALGRSRLIEPELAAGRLIRLHPLSIPNPRAYHPISPDKPASDAAEQPAAWLRQAARAESDPQSCQFFLEETRVASLEWRNRLRACFARAASSHAPPPRRWAETGAEP
jgi:hypothetical protein